MHHGCEYHMDMILSIVRFKVDFLGAGSYQAGVDFDSPIGTQRHAQDMPS